MEMELENNEMSKELIQVQDNAEADVDILAARVVVVAGRHTTVVGVVVPAAAASVPYLASPQPRPAMVGAARFERATT